MTQIPHPDFNDIVKSSGIPTSKSGWKATLKQEADNAGCKVANDSKWSPFWRIIEALVVVPTHWLIHELLINKVMPQMFVATATGKWLELWAWQFDLSRKRATATAGKVMFTRTAEKGPEIVIPSGTWIQTEPLNGSVYRVKVSRDTVLPKDAKTVDAIVEAEFAGAAWNLGAGYYHVLPTAIAGISGASNSAQWLINPGADAEADDDLRLRIRNQFSAVSNWHIDAVYRALLTTRAGINNDNVYFEHGSPRGPGSANAYILLDSGQPSAAMLADLNDYVANQGRHGHGDDLRIAAMPGIKTDISCSIYVEPALNGEQRLQIQRDVEVFIRAAFRENTDYAPSRTEPQKRFSFSKLSQQLHSEFAELQAISFAQSDIVNGMNIPRIRELVVTLEDA